MDEPRERPHMSLIYVCDGPYRGWCGWSFNHGGLGRSGDATVSPRGLPRSTPVLGCVYDILWFYDIKTYTYYVLNMYMYYKKEHWWSLALP